MKISQIIPGILLSVFLGLLSVNPVFAQKRGEVTSRPCPYSCKLQGIPKSVCRDWKDAATNTCYIEDLRKPPGSGLKPDTDGRVGAGEYPTRPTSPRLEPPRNPTDYVKPRPAPTIVQYSAECRDLNRRDIAKPSIYISKIESRGGFFSDKYRVRGSVEGVCLVEAGYFENGRKVEDIPIVSTRGFRRFEFEVKVRTSKEPEIRVYNSAGERDIYEIRTDVDPRDRQDDDNHRGRDDYYYRGR